jgi:hypothetical protein
MSLKVKQRKAIKRENRERFELRMTQVRAKIQAEKQRVSETEWEVRQAMSRRQATVTFGGIYDL